MTITRVGILGGDPLGEAFARALAPADIKAVLSRDSWTEGTLSGLLADLQDMATVTSFEAAAQEDVVLLALSWSELADALSEITDWESRILIDATNPVGPDCEPVDIGSVTSSEVVRDLCPGAQLVKAFNALPATALAAEARPAKGRQVVFLAGDHARAKLEVTRLILRMGFLAIDLGSLASGGKLIQCPNGPLWGKNLLSIEL